MMILATSLLPGAILLWLVVGIIVGFLTSRIMRGAGYGYVGDSIIGIIGAFIGGFITNRLGGSSIISFIFASIGACIMVGILHAVIGFTSRRGYQIQSLKGSRTPSDKVYSKIPKVSRASIRRLSKKPIDSELPGAHKVSPSYEQQASEIPSRRWFQPSKRAIFISHSSKDDVFGRKLVRDIQRELGSRVSIWYDSDGGLHAGDEWWDKIIEALEECDIFIVILSPKAVNSYWVKKELNTAIVAKKHIIPVLYQPCTVRSDLQAIQIISFVPPITYETALTNLTQSLIR